MSFGPESTATLAPLAGYAVAMAIGADHEVRALRAQRSLRSPALIA